jgi:nicotinamide-nucleotide amidase
MRAEIIAIGTELLLGEIADTNTPFLANQLALLGIDLYFTSSVGDNHKRLKEVLMQAWQRSDLILTTGGLGPTQGDVTRESIAEFLGEEPAPDPALEQDLIRFFKQRGLEMPPSNLKQATLIRSSRAIPNPMGTAPGWWIQKEGRTIVAMPGPPAEMQFMWQNEILPSLKDKADCIILSRVIKTLGISEAKFIELLPTLLSSANPTLATYAKPDGIHLRLTAKAAQPQEAREMISKCEGEIRKVLGDAIWGTDDDTLGSVVAGLLVAKGLSLGVAESFTNGLLTHILASTAQSQHFFKGGLVAPSEEVKVAMGLDSSLVSGSAGDETAKAMARLTRCKLGADIGIGIEGYIDCKTTDKIGKVFVAIDSDQLKKRQVQNYTGRLPFMKDRAAYHALFDLSKLLVSAQEDVL